MEINMEEVETKVPMHEFDRKEDSTGCRCSELEERSKKAEGRIVELELEIEKGKIEYDALEAKFKELHAQKGAVEEQLITFMTRSIDVKEQGNSMKVENMGSCEAGKEGDIVVDLTEDGEEEEVIVDQLKVENLVLESDKRKAESEVEVWKEKFKDLELWVLQVDDSTILRGGKKLLHEVIKGENRANVKTGMEQLQIKEKSVDLLNLGPPCSIPGKGVDDLPTAGTPYKDSLCGHTPLMRRKGFCSKSEGDCNRVVVRLMSFEEERSPSKKIAPSTPGGDKSAGLNVINICDSDDESDSPHIQFSIPSDQGIRKSSISTDHVVAGTLDDKKDETSDNYLKTVACSQLYEKDVDDCTDNVPTPKRKRVTKIVTSDTESDEDDNVPISKLKRTHLQESIHDTANSEGALCDHPPISDDVKGIITRSRGRLQRQRLRRLATLRQFEEKVKAERVSSNKTSELKYGQEIPTIDYVEDGEYEDVGSESEDDRFIDDSSDVSNASNVFSQSEDESDDNVDLGKILSKFQRSKDHKLKWELEADMLSAFANDLELCMKAVCALYRQQTSEEQISRETMYHNNRGFSKFDAFRGAELAVFLTDGDPHGDLKKSVKELEDQGSKAVELCRTLASRYSKQLFAIYKNKEDPLFLPS